MKNLESKVIREIGNFFGVPYFRINRQTKIKDDLEAGIVDFKELIWIIEEKYNVSIEDQDLETVGKIIDAIQRDRISSV